jgi:hypothetical protein
MKLCCNCGETAEFSLVLVLSTLGVSPRKQSNSGASLFCTKCVKLLGKRSDALREAVNNVLTAMNLRVSEPSTADNAIKTDSAP